MARQLKKLTKPMKATAVEDLNTLRYPLIASPKFDGIRCLKVGDRLVTSAFKPQPNRYVNDVLTPLLADGMDGELMLAGKPGAHEFNAVSAAFRRREGEPDFVFWLFDWVGDPCKMNMPFGARLRCFESWAVNLSARVQVAPSLRMRDAYQLQAYVDRCLKRGYEGVMVRAPEGVYKCGRSTLREQYLLKIKPFADSEARIVGFEEQQRNTNVATRDECGRLKRTSHKAGKRGKGTLGALIVEQLPGRGVEWREPRFSIGHGVGLTDKLRRAIWNNRKKYIGEIVKYKYQEIGSVDRPRLPIFLGFRDESDL